MLRKLFARAGGGGRAASITVNAANDGATTGKLKLVDVREPHEFAAGHPAGAINVPLSGFPTAVASLPDGPVALTCQSGMRSGKAAKAAVAAGRTDISNVRGGFSAWQAAGLPTQTKKKGNR
ncbi:rhodanese-like domain-containing protein [Paraconexibacter antarcticus]|uniref:Rhodanese-like domain-containing protein n=1 Tax=Paraconexibacter antarcticus TaxID=2949664 RepID=A0ABY5E218_9ACTN|nr:rhodanese-like domain-containing protein [Paraconexibacter antarcticus]UTI66855.1 rhodanese-like domain-containing protein [Paraconexibacter antarcticus]